MIDLDMNLNVQVKDKVFKGSIRDVVRINENNLTEEFVGQPSTYAWFAALAEIASAEVESKKFEISVLRANLDSEKRRELAEKVDKKVTETMVDSAIVTDNRFKACTEELIELQRQLGILRAMVRALDQRKDMLIQLGSTKRQEMVLSDFGVDLKKIRNNQ